MFIASAIKFCSKLMVYHVNCMLICGGGEMVKSTRGVDVGY